MKAKKEIPAICEAVFGKSPERAAWAWEAIADLERAHKSSAVVLDFRNWAAENVGDDFPKGILKAYLDVASERLGSASLPAGRAAKDPEVVSLVRELAYISDNRLGFVDKQKIRLAEVLEEFSAAEILSVFRTWLEDQDLDDPKNCQYGAGKFVQIADQLCYAARKRKQEAEQQAKDRQAMSQKLQARADAERLEAEAAKKAEEAAFDPLADVV